MLTEQNIDKFIELRAQGWTLAHIATELHVSKRTLVDWNREYAADIQSLCAMELELLQEKFLASREEQLNRMLRLQKDVDDELANRCLKFVPMDKLFRLSVELRREIREARLGNGSDEPKPALAPHHRNGSATVGRGACLAEVGRRQVPTAPPTLPGPNQCDGDIAPCLTSTAAARQHSEAAEAERETEPIPSANSAHQLEGGARLSERAAAAHTSNRAPAAPNALSSSIDTLASAPPPQPPVLEQPEREAERIVEASAAPNNPGEESPEAKLTDNLPQPKTNPQEHCLTCGAEVPALLPNGQRPNHYCECGYPLPPPGTSLRETCHKCGELLPVHGTSAQRHWDTCRKCDAKLPPLDPKLPFPWVPPHQRSLLPQI